jgi:hypothetical protein
VRPSRDWGVQLSEELARSLIQLLGEGAPGLYRS